MSVIMGNPLLSRLLVSRNLDQIENSSILKRTRTSLSEILKVGWYQIVTKDNVWRHLICFHGRLVYKLVMSKVSSKVSSGKSCNSEILLMKSVESLVYDGNF